MATIHRAMDLRHERAVAVKLLRPEVSRDPDLAQRFRREALAATVLRHPNIVACLDTGTDGEQPYLVMELIDGEDLAARLKRGGRLAPWQVARIGLDVARGLAVAHVRGIVHRDIKPGNILLAADGRAMVADFGIARLAADAEAALPGTTLGSVHYFSPEQARGLSTTPASDVYGLGLVLYESLTGVRAWTGDSTDAIALARVGAAPPRPSARVGGVPAALEAIVLRALAPEPGDRYPNGSAMAAALEPVATSLAITSPARVAPVAPAPLTSPTSGATKPAAAPPVAPPLVPGSASGRAVAPPPPAAPPARRAVSSPLPPRWSVAPGIALLTLVVVGGALGAFLVAALPGDGAVVQQSSRPRPTATAQAVTQTFLPAPTPTPGAGKTAKPPGTPRPTPTVPPGRVADLCESFFGLPCGLDPARYAPSRFTPAFDVKLGRGWSSALHRADVVTLARDQGSMTFASGVAEAYPGGLATKPLDKARSIVEAFVTTDGLSSTKPASVRIGKKKGLSVDLAPTENRRVTLFTNGSNAFYLEPGRTTRVVVIDVRGHAVVLIIESTGDADLPAILETADVAAGTIRWR
jgi:serine/threonine-protein kinase